MCDIRCKTATTRKCKCSCGGENHGRQIKFGKKYECDYCGDMVNIDEIDFVTKKTPDHEIYDGLIFDICRDCVEKFDVGMINTSEYLSYDN